MLLPSALPCDARRSSRFSPSRLFTTPPPSDTGYPSGSGLQGTCRALQSLLNGSPTPSPQHSSKRLQSPLPIISPRRSPRLRQVAPSAPRPTTPPITTVSTPPPAPKRTNKRRRFDSESDNEMDAYRRDLSSTPIKRRRHVPYNLPLGFSQTTCYSLHSPPVTQSPPSPAQRNMGRFLESSAPIHPDSPIPSIEQPEQNVRSGEWTTAQDERLFELVLEKFALSQQDLEECARRMGRSDCADVSNRLQSFLQNGRVTLRHERR
ncbi:hypothetical protein N7495_006211 [Penicillium taxi]|uniref:uncharacterized protein n=1 Tax=Penicillium taxi TaxID=168475 RepID=UPI0025458B39|nr:uncharacterized protein N7495_006211 [Penicillium taxi]KAJ5894520.1 hypothetical protein N7495_006211 [Penicillium taxi]